jgi:hypothetical protein
MKDFPTKFVFTAVLASVLFETYFHPEKFEPHPFDAFVAEQSLGGADDSNITISGILTNQETDSVRF